MKLVTRYQSQLFVNYKPNRTIRFRPTTRRVFRPRRIGLASKDYEYESYRIPVRPDRGAPESAPDSVAVE